GEFRYGFGVAFPSRNFIRVSGEVNGEQFSQNTATLSSVTPLPGLDMTGVPLISNVENIKRATVGITVQSKKGLFGGVGVSWNMPTQARNSIYNPEGDVFGDYYDLQVRIGWHPGQQAYAPPPPPPPPTPPETPAPPANRPPTVRAQCDPCTVEVG